MAVNLKVFVFGQLIGQGMIVIRASNDLVLVAREDGLRFSLPITAFETSALHSSARRYASLAELLTHADSEVREITKQMIEEQDPCLENFS